MVLSGRSEHGGSILQSLRIYTPQGINTSDFSISEKSGFRACNLQKNQGFSRVMTRPAGRVKGVLKSRGSGRVGSSRFKISRVGSGRVKRFSKSRGSGRVMTREIRVTSRVKP